MALGMAFGGIGLLTAPVAGALAESAAPAASAASEAPQAGGQSAADLRRENARLRQEREELAAQVAKLRDDLEAARAEIADLESKLADARANAGPAGMTDRDPTGAGEGEGTDGDTAGAADPNAAPKPVITVDETDPAAGPRAFRRSLVDSWNAVRGSLEVGTDGRSPARLNYLRSAENWINRSRRAAPVNARAWIVEPVDPAPGAGPVDIRAVRLWEAVDPVSGASLGRPFPMRINASLLRRFERAEERNGRTAPAEQARGLSGRPQYTVSGRIIARLKIDSTRPTIGTFDNPPLLAPCITCELGLEVESGFGARREEREAP